MPKPTTFYIFTIVSLFLLASCCGERKLKLIDYSVILQKDTEFNPETDTLFGGGILLIFFDTETLEDCDCTACLNEEYSNPVKPDDISISLDVPIISSIDSFPPGTDLFEIEPELFLPVFLTDSWEFKKIQFPDELINGIHADSAILTVDIDIPSEEKNSKEFQVYFE